MFGLDPFSLSLPLQVPELGREGGRRRREHRGGRRPRDEGQEGFPRQEEEADPVQAVVDRRAFPGVTLILSPSCSVFSYE